MSKSKEILELHDRMDEALDEAMAKIVMPPFPQSASTANLADAILSFRNRMPDPWNNDVKLQDSLLKLSAELIRKSGGGLSADAVRSLARDRAQRRVRECVYGVAARHAMGSLRTQINAILDLVARATGQKGTVAVSAVNQVVIGVDDGAPVKACRLEIKDGPETVLELLGTPRGALEMAWIRNGERHTAEIETLDAVMSRLPQWRVFENWFETLAGYIIVLVLRARARRLVANFFSESEKYIQELFTNWRPPEDQFSALRTEVRQAIIQVVLAAQRVGLGVSGEADAQAILTLQRLIDARLRLLQAAKQQVTLQQTELPRFTIYDLESYHTQVEESLARQVNQAKTDIVGEDCIWNGLDVLKFVNHIVGDPKFGDPVMEAMKGKLDDLLEPLRRSAAVETSLGRVGPMPGNRQQTVALELPHPHTEPKYTSRTTNAPAELVLSPRGYIKFPAQENAGAGMVDRLSPTKLTYATLCCVLPQILPSMLDNSKNRVLQQVLKIANIDKHGRDESLSAAVRELADAFAGWHQIREDQRVMGANYTQRIKLVT